MLPFFIFGERARNLPPLSSKTALFKHDQSRKRYARFDSKFKPLIRSQAELSSPSSIGVGSRRSYTAVAAPDNISSHLYKTVKDRRKGPHLIFGTYKLLMDRAPDAREARRSLTGKSRQDWSRNGKSWLGRATGKAERP